MEYKDFIKPGNKVIFYPMSFEWDNNFDVDPQVVTISEYRPYYRDGSPDPTPDEYDESCYVEIVENIHGECQIRLEDLFPIEPCDKDVVYCGQLYKCIGKNDELGRVVLQDCDDFIVRYDDDVQEYRDVYDLDREELCRLFNQCGIGSIYLSDYENDLGITRIEASSVLEDFADTVDWNDDLMRPNNFADYILCEG